QNTFAHEKRLVDYPQIGDEIPGDHQAYVVIMTFGYRTDKVVLEQLMDQSFRYIGMLGSDKKIAEMKTAFTNEGVNPDRYAHVHMPIGVPIFSKTAGEIAVSVAAEITREKNKNLPTGRAIANL
ncbi:MAG: XdhC family protein, partial [Saprospiraceae bacterium]|nr:XdhC family protein [Saprospiraceae bacterium]